MRIWILMVLLLGLQLPAGALAFEVNEIDLPGSHGSTHEIVVLPDGSMLVSQQSSSRLVRIAADGTKAEITLPAATGPHGMAVDRNGNIWVTFEYSNEIVKLDDSGRIVTRYPIPVPSAGAHGLTISSDGSI